LEALRHTVNSGDEDKPGNRGDGGSKEEDGSMSNDTEKDKEREHQLNTLQKQIQALNNIKNQMVANSLDVPPSILEQIEQKKAEKVKLEEANPAFQVKKMQKAFARSLELEKQVHKTGDNIAWHSAQLEWLREAQVKLQEELKQVKEYLAQAANFLDSEQLQQAMGTGGTEADLAAAKQKRTGDKPDHAMGDAEGYAANPLLSGNLAAALVAAEAEEL
jgi:hypothetical protein